MESVFVHDTVVPAGTVSGLGLNAFGPSVAAPLGIEIVAADPGALDPGIGAVGATGVELYDDPQPMASDETIAVRPIRMRDDENIAVPPRMNGQQRRCQVGS
jgi:hypothetical protein